MAKQRIKLTIKYDGTQYVGWQKQVSTDRTIQGIIEQKLSELLGELIYINGAGRTDAGVHAIAQIADFSTKADISCNELLYKLNNLLPDDIVITKAKEASPRFHSRYSAIGKTYEYRLVHKENYSVFKRKYEYKLEVIPDIDAMKSASKYLLGKHDFKSFVTHAAKQKDTVRNIKAIEITENKGHIVIAYNGDGFLYNMIRILTGTLLDIGFGNHNPEYMQIIIEAKNRLMAGETMPPYGLFLIGVDYD